MGIGRRIADARKGAGLPQWKLAELVGTAQTTVSSWERGRTEPTRDDVQRVATALGVGPAQLEFDDPAAGDAEPTVPVVGYVGAGSVAHYYASGQGELDRVPAPKNAKAETVAAEVRGVSLGPVLDGWLVYWDEVRNPVTPDLIGKLCVVGLPNDQVLVKEIQSAGSAGRFHLISNSNEAPIFDQEVLWAAKVTGILPR